MNYNYVVFASSWDLYKQSYSDLFDKPYARYVSDRLTNLSGWRRYLYNIQYDPHIYTRFNVPFLKFWYPYYFKDDFATAKSFVFVFTGRWLLNEYADYTQYLKTKYPDAKFVLFLHDLLCMTKGRNKSVQLDINKIRKQFDLILSFDQNDCNKYGFIYHPLVFSDFHGQLEEMSSSDVYFLGKAKNRLSEIISTFEKLWEYNLNTDLYLVGVDCQDQVYKDKIHYIDKMSYNDNLQHILHTNCELEIMQSGGWGYTQRMCEVISLGKRLITNNPTVHEAPFYNSKYICQITSAKDITPEFCDEIKKGGDVDYHYKEKLSPIELLEFIERHLTDKE